MSHHSVVILLMLHKCVLKYCIEDLHNTLSFCHGTQCTFQCGWCEWLHINLVALIKCLDLLKMQRVLFQNVMIEPDRSLGSELYLDVMMIMSVCTSTETHNILCSV